MPYLTPDAPSGNTGRVLVIPDTYLASVDGALQELAEIFNWEEFGDETEQEATDRMQQMVFDYLSSSIEEFNSMAAPITPQTWAYNQISIAATWTSEPTFRGAGYLTSGNNAINGFIEWKIWTAAGTWTMLVNAKKRNNSGIATLSVDGVDIVTGDFYNTTPLEAVVTMVIGALTTGSHLVRLTFKTKNASSTNYGWQIGEIEFQRLT